MPSANRPAQRRPGGSATRSSSAANASSPFQPLRGPRNRPPRSAPERRQRNPGGVVRAGNGPRPTQRLWLTSPGHARNFPKKQKSPPAETGGLFSLSAPWRISERQSDAGPDANRGSATAADSGPYARTHGDGPPPPAAAAPPPVRSDRRRGPGPHARAPSAPPRPPLPLP